MSKTANGIARVRAKAKRLGILNWERMDLEDLLWWIQTHERFDRQKAYEKAAD